MNRRAEDYYGELMRASQAARQGLLAERDRWLRSVQVDGREELLFELEMLLRAVERAFNLQHLSADEREQPLLTRDFRDELHDVHDAIQQALRIARQLLAPGDDQKLVFRKYIETQLADDRVRRELLEEELEQDTPQESLFVLRQALDSLRTVMEHLALLPGTSLTLFTEVGNLALREIVLSRFFRPFRPLEFRSEYDRIRSVRLLEVLATLGEPDRSLFSVALLGLFRLLHYLSYVGSASEASSPRRTRVLFLLVRSEAMSLASYLRGEVAVKAGQRPLKAMALRAARDLGQATERLLREPGPRADATVLVEVAQGFTSVLREQLVTLADALGAGVGRGEGAYEQLVSPERMAERLREELWLLAHLCRGAETALRQDELARAEQHLEALRRYLPDFYDVGFQLLRYMDHEAFDRFSALLLELPWPPEGPGTRRRLAEDLRHFSNILERTFSSVSQRLQLRTLSFDRGRADARLAHYLALPQA